MAPGTTEYYYSPHGRRQPRPRPLSQLRRFRHLAICVPFIWRETSGVSLWVFRLFRRSNFRRSSRQVARRLSYSSRCHSMKDKLWYCRIIMETLRSRGYFIRPSSFRTCWLERCKLVPVRLERQGPANNGNTNSPEARMLTKRIPETLVKSSSSLQNCSLLLRAVWQRNYDKIYKLLRELPWPDQLKPLVRRYEGKQKSPPTLGLQYH